MFEEYTYGFREAYCIVCPKWAFYFIKWLFCLYSMSRAEYRRPQNLNTKRLSSNNLLSTEDILSEKNQQTGQWWRAVPEKRWRFFVCAFWRGSQCVLVFSETLPITYISKGVPSWISVYIPCESWNISLQIYNYHIRP